jgi:nitrous oxide reductase accessory protein NosL
VVEIGGQRREACCPQCAVSESRQEHKPVRLISVRDYSTAKVIDPAQAYYVNHSRALACSHDAMHMDEMKHAYALKFDRCSPGAFAFAKKEEAEAFIAQNGGQILSMEQLLGGANTQ